MSVLHLSEAILDDSDVLVTVWYVDLRKPENRIPIRTLVKACRNEHAISDLRNLSTTLRQ